MADRNRSVSVLSWQAPEFFYYSKSSGWYTAVFGLAAVVLIILWLLNLLDWTNGLVVITGLIVLVVLAGRPPRTITVRIGQSGIQIGSTSLAFEQIASFHISDHQTHHTLDLQTKQSALPASAVITETDPETVRQVVGRYLPEKTTETSYIADVMGRWLHF